jgi:hypothetical protein
MSLGYFGKGAFTPPPPPPPPHPDTGPTITAIEEQMILQQTLPLIAPEQSFLSRNKTPILLGGTVLILGVIGMVVLVKI